MAAIATPATSQASTKAARLGASPIAAAAGAPSRKPKVITRRGPARSSHRPIGIPASADTTSPAENAAVVTDADQPVSAVIDDSATGKA